MAWRFNLIQHLTGVDRRLSAVIAIKHCGDANNECMLLNSSWYVMLDLLDELAAARKVSCVRKFGDVWIGCLGFFQSWKKTGADCYHATEMACAAMKLCADHNMRVCCAVDYGSIVGGFVVSIIIIIITFINFYY